MKTYKIISHDGTNETILDIPENELTPEHKALLLGELVHTFNNMPPEIQMNFLNNLTNSLKQKINGAA